MYTHTELFVTNTRRHSRKALLSYLARCVQHICQDISDLSRPSHGSSRRILPPCIHANTQLFDDSTHTYVYK